MKNERNGVGKTNKELYELFNEPNIYKTVRGTAVMQDIRDKQIIN